MLKRRSRGEMQIEPKTVKADALLMQNVKLCWFVFKVSQHRSRMDGDGLLCFDTS